MAQPPRLHLCLTLDRLAEEKSEDPGLLLLVSEEDKDRVLAEGSFPLGEVTIAIQALLILNLLVGALVRVLMTTTMRRSMTLHSTSDSQIVV